MDCASQLRLLRVEWALLEATLPDAEPIRLSHYFLSRLKARLRDGRLAEWPGFWELFCSRAKRFAAIAGILVFLVGGLNLYARLKRPEKVEALDSPFLEVTDSDEISLILQEGEAPTPEQVLDTLVVMKGGENGR
ncbi:MAG: hypothetical protein HY314_13630 [Acidobacteria bacterium]|nr:hypothetical protein [Acidobacteriota bacterium]